MKLFSSLLLLATLAFADDVSTVRGLAEKFNAAAKQGDSATLNNLLSDKLVYVHSNGKIENKAECIGAIVKTKPNFVFSPGWNVMVQGKTAIVHGKATNNPGTASPVALDMMQTWTQEGGSWKMLGRHTARPPAQ